MNRATRVAIGLAASFALLTPNALAVPTYARQYGVSCSTCHPMWGGLNPAGATFRLSGYRAILGKDLTPTEKPIEIANGALTIPGTFPASIITGAAVEYRHEVRRPATATADLNSTGATITVADASIFLTGPLGKHLSFFMEFPMFESKAWEFTPTGPGEVNNPQTGPIRFAAESPAFEVAKFWWNNLLGDAAPRDSVNLLFGITHLPLAYPSGKVRLSVNQFLVYERRGLDYISPKRVQDIMSTESADRLFRLGEPQGMAEVNGMITPGKPVTDVSKRDTFWLEYHAGVTNASNSATDNNLEKGIYGRLVARWWTQSLGVFAFWTPNIMDPQMIREASVSTGGIMANQEFKNATVRIGPDATINLGPLGLPVTIDNQVLYNRESNPTGYGKEFVWWGGFDQVNWLVVPRKATAYARYDWIQGNSYDDTTSVDPTGAPGITKAHPKEWDVVGGLQYLVLENFKLIGEYRHHRFEDTATNPSGKLTDDGFTARAMVGF
jgi:hypothetical protein